MLQKAQKRKFCFLTLAFFLIGFVGNLKAGTLKSHAGAFANAKEVFAPLVADPHEIQMVVRWIGRVGKKNLGDVAIGDYAGIYRWVLPWEDAYIQWSFAGGIFSRFDLAARNKANIVNDFEAAMPIDFRKGRWSARLFPYHISSHLGDDYIVAHDAEVNKYSYNAIKFFGAYEPVKAWRIYTGYNAAIRGQYSDQQTSAVQGGLEWRGPWIAGGIMQPYWATDVQSWARTDWNVSFATQAGITLRHDPEARSGVAIYTEYGAGNLMYGQFLHEKESRWVLGLRYEIS